MYMAPSHQFSPERFSSPSEISAGLNAIRPPPGLELPLLPQNDASEPHVRQEEASANEEKDASAKLRAYLAESVDDETLAMSIIQRAHWNLACVRVAQQSLYAQHLQACLQQQQQQLCAQEHTFAKSSRGDMPTRPPGVWSDRVRASSCSSLASTRASSEDESASHRSEKFRVEIPTSDPFCGGGRRVCWSVDAKKFSSCDMQIVSPTFELTPSVEFKLLIKSAAQGSKRGQAGFKASLGQGSIELKCISGSSAQPPRVTFRLSLIGHCGTPQKRIPVSHDFNEETVYFPSGQNPWDFRGAIGQQSQEVVVCLEVAPVQ